MTNWKADHGQAQDHDYDMRLGHIIQLRALGVDPYPAAAWGATHTANMVVANASDYAASGEGVRLAGRIVGRRTMGGAAFLDLLDDGTRIQLHVSRSKIGEPQWNILGLLDLGDFVGIEGTVFFTQRGEKTVDASTLCVLGKPTRAIPLGKRSGDGVVHQALSQPGRLLRDRHVELQVNDNFRRRIIMRDRLLRTMRSYFYEQSFVEVDTPILGRAYGGAAAKPFTTYSEALDVNLFLRVSPECNLKRALAGGINRIFEIGKNFRNEGIDHSHQPEFTAVEWYEIGSDYLHQMARFEALVARLANVISETGIVYFRGRGLDFTPPWPRLRVLDLVAEKVGVPCAELTPEIMSGFWQHHGIEGDPPTSWGELLMGVFEETIEPGLVGPVFIIDHPAEVSPLTKRHRLDSRLTERFEPFVMGLEIGNGYSELNDPTEQRQRLMHQELARDEPYGLDEQFLRALEDGLPQAGGSGLGVDRLLMILLGAERLSDVILLPAS